MPETKKGQLKSCTRRFLKLSVSVHELGGIEEFIWKRRNEGLRSRWRQLTIAWPQLLLPTVCSDGCSWYSDCWAYPSVYSDVVSFDDGLVAYERSASLLSWRPVSSTCWSYDCACFVVGYSHSLCCSRLLRLTPEVGPRSTPQSTGASHPAPGVLRHRARRLYGIPITGWTNHAKNKGAWPRRINCAWLVLVGSDG